MRSYLSALLIPVLFGVLASCAPDLSESSRREAWVQRTLENLSLDQMVSQMFMVDVPESAAYADSAAHSMLLHNTVGFEAGGIVLFASSPVPQAALVNDLQKHSHIPLLVAQDMEWGASMRIKHASEFPRAMAIGATGDPELAFLMGRITALEAEAVGVNMLLAPVADVNTRSENPVIGTRSFGDDPRRVASFVGRFIEGVQTERTLATAKHYPGHGSTTVDSHVATPLIDVTRIEPDTLDLFPFITAIEANVGAIMTAHLAVTDSSGDSEVPATLSSELLDGVLRARLGFGGLVISDALNMAGVGVTSVDSLVVRAIAAGVDILLMPPERFRAKRAVLQAVEEGRITPQRIRASTERILRAKARLSLTRTPKTHLGTVRPVLASAEHRSLADLAARRSIVALRNDGTLPEIGSGKSILLIDFVDQASSQRADYFDFQVRSLSKGNVITQRVTRDSWSEDSPGILEAADGYDLIVFADLTSEFRSTPLTIGRVLSQLSSVSDRLIFAGMGSPYSAAGIPDGVNAALISFGAARPSIRAMAQSIFGSTDVCGKLPVHLSPSFPRGSGVCIQQAVPRRGRPEDGGLDGALLDDIASVLRDGIENKAFPGAAVAVGHDGLLAFSKGFGRFTYNGGPPVEPASRFDLASLTKVIATTTAVMLLYDADSLSLDDHVVQYIPEFAANGKESVTIRDLLMHTGGLIPFRAFYQTEGMSKTDVLDAIYADSLFYEPGAMSRYSDFGPIVLAEIIERITEMPFDAFTRERIFIPLGMKDTGFRPADGTSDPSIVPTENDDYFRMRLVQGEVHDENAYLLGGTAGHAGLFSTAEDLSRFAYMMLREGKVGDRYYIRPETVRLFTTATDPFGAHTRALGWDTKSPVGYSAAGRFFGMHSFGHTGFTGTSIWFDPDQGLYVILLTNRVHPTRDNARLSPIRPAVADAVYRALRAGSSGKMGFPSFQ